MLLDLPPVDWMTEAELMAKPIGSAFVYDVECYPNFFMVAFRCELTGKVVAVFDTPTSRLNVDLLSYLMNGFQLYGYNSSGYDLPMCSCALAGFTAAQLHDVSRAIIYDGMKPWKLKETFNVELAYVRNVDIQPVVPLKGSLKMRGAQMATRIIQELPYDPSQPLTYEQAMNVTNYCGIDLQITSDLVASLKEQLAIRVVMSREYGLDLMSKSDAQLSEAIIKKEIGKLTGKPVPKQKKQANTFIRYDAPAWMCFTSQGMQELLARITASPFPIDADGYVSDPDWLKGTFRVSIAGKPYTMGIGGLHSNEKRIAYKSSATMQLIDRDVASYYPAIIITQQLRPDHLGEPYSIVYTAMRDRRLEAKARVSAAKKRGEKPDQADEDMTETLKIAVNGGFGKGNSPFSVLYSPKLFLQVVLTGQLAILMLIERLSFMGIEVVSANTDGIVINCPRAREAELAEVFKQWEAFTQFETEETRYAAYYARDVNSYVAITDKGKVKHKGDYGNPWALTDWTEVKSKIFRFHQTPDLIICVEAVHAFLRDRTPIEKTIRECKDPSRFVTVRKVTGGAEKNGIKLGSVVRWYYSTDSPGPIRTVKKSAKTGLGKAVGSSEGAMPMMRLTDELPYDVDFDRYIKIAKDMLDNCGWSFKRQLTFD